MRRHGVFGALVLLGMVARVLVMVAYPPGLMYLGDSGAYLDQAWRGLWPGDWRPSGYPIFLRLVDGPEHITRIVLIQHGLTLVVAAGLYASALRVVRRPWLAALAAAPALLAPWVLDLGQFVLADSLFGVLVGAGVVLLAWPRRVRAPMAAAAGALLGAALCVRTVGYGPLAVALIVLVLDTARAGAGPSCAGRASRLPWRWVHPGRRMLPVLALLLGAAVPAGAYAGWSAAEGAGFTVSAHSGFFLYGRVAPFADCTDIAGAELRSLCDPRPVDQRGAPVRYLWPADSPLRQGNRRVPPGREELAGRFAHEVVRDQPWMLVTSSARYLLGYFSPVPHETTKTSRADTWELPTDRTNALPPDDPHADDGYFVATTVRAPAGLLAAWSRVSYPLMPLVGVGLVAGLAAAAVGAVRTWRARPGRRGRAVAAPRTPRTPGEPGTAHAAIPAAEGSGAADGGSGGLLRLYCLAAGAGGTTLVLSAVTSGFDYRYLGAVIGLIGLAAMMGVIAFVRVVRHRPSGWVDRLPRQGG
ncbi:hypothetical protein MXD59_19765 [Frankia sp. Ag45/Mut15]|uniref:Glycosyltransferase RgtA/B/C/D-like domain-containing protein n=1 Tax=Frankia umida TaxID=573489 RepID=A0ABT0K3W9_9ACTN|nr:hypothetical protein [Frankia umida]MCK9877983.1 hypothetical protein [Frankia umida]